MPDYKKMYSKQFLEINDTIERLKSTLLGAEEMYINSEEVSLTINSAKQKSKKQEETPR